ncbi:glycosyltransferase family 2 protein [Gangjinia marincola]
MVSIIIPAYNRSHIIGDTIASIINQSYTNWECIVVDDGSTDDTSNLLERLMKTERRLSYYKRPSHIKKGANACRNYGLEMSKGDYIQWFDSDDLMMKEKIEVKISHALTYKADVIKDAHSTNPVKIYPKEHVTSFTSSDFYIDYILGKKPMITNDVMLKRSAIGDHRFDENIHKAQEYEFFGRVFCQKLTYVFTNLPLAVYNTTSDSISNKTAQINKKQQFSLIYLSKKLMETHSNNPLIIAKAKRQGRKTYKKLMLHGKVNWICEELSFFRICHNRDSVTFLGYALYNYITKKGFDRIKKGS